MPYYHIRLYWYTRDEPPKITHWDLINLNRTYVVKEIIEPHLKEESFEFRGTIFPHSQVAELEIRETPSKVLPLYDFSYGTNVTDRFMAKKRKEEPQTQKSVVESNNVFIVHGRTHKPMKELKAMLRKFGLNPIVLHEQPSGSRTIVEKLEKYSNVGYAFVILTPDDAALGNFFPVMKKIVDESKERFDASIPVDTLLPMMKKRARQNVVLEFGYFIGLLGRDRVCCLYKGDIELPSDMHGIVYTPFEKSIAEVKGKIIKELKAAGYKLKV